MLDSLVEVIEKIFVFKVFVFKKFNLVFDLFLLEFFKYHI